MSTGFTIPPAYDNQIVFYFKTNHEADSLSWTLQDWNGNVIRRNGPIINNSLYVDTLQLDKGCYLLSIMNSYGEGLSYWANMPPYGNGTSGYARIKDMNGKTIKLFKGDFGRMVSQSFTVDMPIHVDEIDPAGYIHVFPNPSQGRFTIAIVQEKAGDVDVAVTDGLGNLILSRSFAGVRNSSLSLDLTGLSPGMYLARIKTSAGSVIKKLIIL